MNKTTKNIFKVLLGSTIASSFLEPLIERLQGVLGNTVHQVKDASAGFVRQLIEMVVIACLGLIGIIFMLMGLALFLESRADIPGSGLGYVGIGILLFALLSLLVMKYHKK